ncbi:MAG: phosphatase PAP2 family protein [Flavobacteriales bacterium]|nr:phosphatase PAP2 family protein [Flavobacteriales bacterium]
MFRIKINIILDSIIDIDTNLFLFLNGIHTPFWDVIFYWVTSRVFWIPFYLVLFYFSYLKFKWRAVYVLLFFGIVLSIGDLTSVKLFKEVFERLRPCHNPNITDLVHTLQGHCGGQFGFVSSHATNSFALAVFSGLLLRNKFNYVFPVMLFWAALVSYSRIYVGVHYPVDLFGGAALGSIVAIFVFWLLKISNKKLKLKLNNL